MDIVTTLFYTALAGALLWGAYSMFISPKVGERKKSIPMPTAMAPVSVLWGQLMAAEMVAVVVVADAAEIECAHSSHLRA